MSTSAHDSKDVIEPLFGALFKSLRSAIENGDHLNQSSADSRLETVKNSNFPTSYEGTRPSEKSALISFYGQAEEVLDSLLQRVTAHIPSTGELTKQVHTHSLPSV
jgi:hypothetical protein